MAQNTGSRPSSIFPRWGEALHSFLQKADPVGRVSDIKISASALMNPSVGRLLKETGAESLGGMPVHFSRGFFGLSAATADPVGEYRCYPLRDVPLLAHGKGGFGIGSIVSGVRAAGS